ncbi:alpha/beta hydrolase [Alishewanella sp. HH-ZS]|uniref:alpha/beta hydrolase n=1 Tax=Alishewanella sp. HH-ZS TaxID=1856684 RepID=UPI0008235AD5|nr:alpha/beta hydrolase [Alishewanella sp. HH-ZS]OCW96213.1 hypothetical protein A9165_12815 [Alishewanella sp. HH-ZS]
MSFSFFKLIFMQIFLLCLAKVQIAFAESHSVSIMHDNNVINGTMYIPEGYSSGIIALIISGSGPVDRDGNVPGLTNNSLKMLAHELGKSGIASLRYDKRGVGDSISNNVDESLLTFDLYVEDAVLWIEKLGNDKRFKRIVVIGHSDGSLVGMVASRNSLVDKFISINSSSLKADDLILMQIKDKYPEYLDETVSIISKIKSSDNFEVEDEFLKLIFRKEIHNFLFSWFRYDPKVEFSKLKIPSLVVHGKNDVQINFDSAVQLNSVNKLSKLVLIDNMNHILKDSSLDQNDNFSTYNNPSLPVSSLLIEEVVSFIKD